MRIELNAYSLTRSFITTDISQNELVQKGVQRAFGSDSEVDEVPTSLLLSRFSPLVKLADQSLEEDRAASKSEQSAYFDQIRSELSSLRGYLEDQNSDVLTSDEQQSLQTKIDEAIQNIGKLAGVSIAIGGIANAKVEGLDSNQILDLSVLSLETNGSLAITGTIDSLGENAQIVILGDGSGELQDNASFTIEGKQGSMTVRAHAGTSLVSIAEEINQNATDTGVAAAVSGENLYLTSVDKGSQAFVAVHAASFSDSLEFSGLNSNQFESFQVNSLQTANASFSGRLTQSSDIARASYLGRDGRAADTATFEITGYYGTETFSMENGEELTDIALRINNESEQTGVVASVDGDELVFESTLTGSRAFVQVTKLSDDDSINVSGVNEAQIGHFSVDAFETGASHLLSGTVTRSADQARISLQGNESGQVIAGAEFELVGSQGATNIQIIAGESLSDVAERVNAASEETGVSARVSGTELIFESSDYGSSHFVDINILQIDQTVETSGVNGSQFQSFTVNEIDSDTNLEISGTVHHAASKARLEYTGFLGRTTNSATITLEGNSGSTSISVTALESLNSVVSKVNAKTEETGVTARKSGQKIIFESVGVGTDAFINIDDTSGNFEVDGGDGDGHDTGSDATATFNGQYVVAQGNTFELEVAGGSFSLESVQGFTGTISNIQVSSTSQELTLTGGDENLTAYGVDVEAEINGVTWTGVGDSLTVADEVGQFTLQFVTGFTGAFDDVQVSSDQGFLLSGVDETGTAYGQDAVAEVNGETVTADGDNFTFETSEGNFSFRFTTGFTGTFDTFSLEALVGDVNTIGGDGEGRAVGVDATATINGLSLVGDGNTFLVEGNSGTARLTVQDYYLGEIDSISITPYEATGYETLEPGYELSSQGREDLNELVNNILDFASGGELSVTNGNEFDKESLIDEVDTMLNEIELAENSLLDAQIDTAELLGSYGDSTSAEVLALTFQTFSSNNLDATISNFDFEKYNSSSGRSLVVELLR